MINVVLIAPEIPPNTGNVARLCAATRSTLHLIEPLGFKVDDTQLKRAGMDYWQHVTWKVWPNWHTFLSSIPSIDRLWLIESGGAHRYDEVTYQTDDYLVFGRETKGLPSELLETYPSQWVRIPMFHKTARSLNLSNTVSIVLYEALRQQGFQGEE